MNLENLRLNLEAIEDLEIVARTAGAHVLLDRLASERKAVHKAIRTVRDNGRSVALAEKLTRTIEARLEKAEAEDDERAAERAQIQLQILESLETEVMR